jgi:competence protein ComGC
LWVPRHEPGEEFRRHGKGRKAALTGTIMSGASLVMLPVIGLLAAIAIPNFVKAREASQKNACVANLRQIQGAKDTWALENKKTTSETPTAADLYGPQKYIKGEPTCPAGGTYSINSVAETPTCSVPAHVMY